MTFARTFSTRNLVLCATIVLFAVAGFYSGRTLSIRTAEAQVSTRTPVNARAFYLERTIRTANGAGDISILRQEIVARRSDGTTARMQSIGPSEPPVYMRKVIYPDGTSITVTPAVSAKTTWPPFTQHELERFLRGVAVSHDCEIPPYYTRLRSESLAGQSVIVIQRIIPEKFRVTRWLAPELGCEDFSYTSEAIRLDGTFTFSAQASLSKLKMGDPEPELFDSASGFAELRPSEVQQRLQQYMKLNFAPEQLRNLNTEAQWADEIYDGKARTRRY